MLCLDTLKVDAVSNQLDMAQSIIGQGSNVNSDRITFKLAPTYTNSSLTGLSIDGTISSSSSGSTSETSNYDDLSVGGSYSVSNTTTGGSISWGTHTSGGSGTYGGTTERGAGTTQEYFDGNVSSSGSISMSENGTFSGSVSASGSSVSGSFINIKIPVKLYFDNLNIDIDPLAYYMFSIFGDASDVSTGGASITNVCLYTRDGSTLVSSNGTQYGYIYIQGKDVLSNKTDHPKGSTFILDFWVSDYDISSEYTVGFTYRYSYVVRSLKDSYKYDVGSISSSDTTLQNLQKENNETTEDTNETTHSIFDSISSFFASFFQNIINSLISVFVPEDGYFSNWFSRVNSLLADKLGVLYYPFNMIISFLSDLQSASSQSGQIVFPEVALPMNGERYVIIERTVLNLGDYDVATTSSENSSLVGSSGYTSVLSTIRTFSSFAVVLALVSLFLKKLNHIVNGEDA